MVPPANCCTIAPPPGIPLIGVTNRGLTSLNDQHRSTGAISAVQQPWRDLLTFQEPATTGSKANMQVTSKTPPGSEHRDTWG